MQLRSARLCLDCEELHEDHYCPVCASQAFAYLTQWIPVDERRRTRRAALKPPAPPPSTTGRWMRRAAAGLALVAAGSVVWGSKNADRRGNGGNDKVEGGG